MSAALEGLVYDLDEREYHRSPALSSTGLVRMLQAPKKYRHYRDNPEPARKAFDVGTAVHSKVLGTGAPIRVIPAEVLSATGAVNTAAAREFIAQARAEGAVPVKQAEADEVNAMAESVLAHPLARSLFEQSGNAEVSVFADDPDTGVPIRCRFDYLPDFTVDDPWCVDLKTTARRASRDGFVHAVEDPELRYDVRSEFYRHTYAAATGEFTARMKFVVVEKTPPYLVAVHELGRDYQEGGRRRMREALAKYALCSQEDLWPGYPMTEDPVEPTTTYMFQEGVIA